MSREEQRKQISIAPEERICIIGAGLAGLSAAITLSQRNIPCHLISAQPSERAQSVLAEGGINGALNTMGENDCVDNHREDTLRAGVFLADPEAVRGLTESAPGILRFLSGLGVPFNTREDGEIFQRNFGGQKKKRTAYARSSTGKALMSALIDEVRRYEAAGLVRRWSHHELVRLILEETTEGRACRGAAVWDRFLGAVTVFRGPVLLASGGMNGVFPGSTTGTVTNSGDVTAQVFRQGVRLSNLEMIQFHPTTFGIAGKRCLVTEAARGEGGRLYVLRDGKPWYFMEERYPELKNLMPRDVVSREMTFVLRDPACEGPVVLDMTHLSGDIWKKRLPDLREELIHYLGRDPAKQPIPVEPGIHYFMGGIDVDVRHRTNVPHLYAAGECCSQYHGANRLGANSTLGAIYGGQVAAEEMAAVWLAEGREAMAADGTDFSAFSKAAVGETSVLRGNFSPQEPASPELIAQVAEILLSSMGILRTGARIEQGLTSLRKLQAAPGRNEREVNRLLLAEAMLESARIRTESRGAHYREDFPQRDDTLGRMTKAECPDGSVRVTL